MRPINFIARSFLDHLMPEGEALRPLVRWDLAWALFLPDSPGELPAGDSRQSLPLARWYWETMGRIGGRLRSQDEGPVWCIVPPLSPAAQEFATRLASFWSDEIYWLTADDPETGCPAEAENCWLAPVYDVTTLPQAGTLRAHFGEVDQHGEEAWYAMPALGVGRAFFRVEVIPPGKATARLHSHSAVDEYYLVLSGRGTLRMGAHAIAVGPQQLIGKPIGPDLTSHLVADQGDVLTVLDMEVWPDATLSAKDVVSYPDFNELFYRGSGWGAIAPQDGLSNPEDFRRHYDEGYRRKSDGNWEPQAIPGTVPRGSADPSGRAE